MCEKCTITEEVLPVDLTPTNLIKMMNSLTQFLFKNRPAWLLSLFRFLFCSAIFLQLLRMEDSLKAQILVLKCGSTPIMTWLGFSIGFDLLSYLYLSCLVGLFFSAIGFVTRLSLLTSTISFFLVLSTSIGCTTGGSADVYTPWNHAIVVFNLLILTISSGVNRYSVDTLWKSKQKIHLVSNTVPNWTLWLLKFNLVYSYFAGGIVKIKFGLDWMNGYTLQYYLLFRHLHLDTPLGFELAQNFSLMIILSIGTVLLELLFPLVLFYRRFAIFAITTTLLVQAMFWIITDLRWMLFFGAAYFVYLVEAIEWLISKPWLNFLPKKESSDFETLREIDF